MNTGVGCKHSDAFYKNSGHIHQNSKAFDAISCPFDALSVAFLGKLCDIFIKWDTVMNIGVDYNDSDAFYKNSGQFNQNSKAFDAISCPLDALSGAFFWIVCTICIK